MFNGNKRDSKNPADVGVLFIFPFSNGKVKGLYTSNQWRNQAKNGDIRSLNKQIYENEQK